MEHQDRLTLRIRQLKASVRKATEEAMRTGSKEDIIELNTGDGNENDNPNLSSSESFALGMTLFGQDPVAVEHQIGEKLKGLEDDLGDIVESLKMPQQEETVASVAADASALETQSKDLKAKIAFLQLCNEVRQSLDESSELTSQVATNEPNYVLAAEKVCTAQRTIQEAENMVKSKAENMAEPNQALFGAYRILESLRTTARRKKVDLVHKATNLLEVSVDIRENSITVRGGEPSGSPQQQLEGIHAAYDVLEALSPTDHAKLDLTLKKLTDQLVGEIIEPHLQLYQDNGMVVTPLLFSGPNRRKVRVLEWSESEEAKNSVRSMTDSWKETFVFLQRVIAFFQEHVLLGRERLCQIVGERLFGRVPSDDNTLHDLEALGVESDMLTQQEGLLTKTILQLLKESCVPSSLPPNRLSELTSMRSAMLDCASNFEKEMSERKLYYFEGDKPFESFASNFERHYVDKRRSLVLNEAREILLRDDYHNTSMVGENMKANRPGKIDGLPDDDGLDTFKLHKSAVSNSAIKILMLCRQTLDEATDPEMKPTTEQLRLLPPMLYRTAREVLDIFRAIIPSTLVEEIATVPRTAAVLHNDCVFFAHHCLTMGLRYKERYQPAADDVRGQTLRQVCIFVDMVQPFRELADRSMGDMLNRQSQEIAKIVGPNIELLADALQSNESLSEWVDAESAMTKALYQVERSAKVWCPVLSQGVFSRSIGFLMDTIFDLYLSQVFKSTGISEPASRFASSLFRQGMQSCAGMLGNDMDGCRMWDRFSAVGRFMDMSLSDIQVALADGVFRGLTAPELSKLIVATFDDSEKRFKLLQALAKES